MKRLLVLSIPTLLLAALWAAAQDAQPRRGFSITITEPANQSVALGKTRIAAEVKARSPELIDRVEFLVGDTVVFVDREAPWECIHDFGGSPKSFVVRAVAYHVEGPAVSDAVITRKLDISKVEFEDVNRVILWATVTDRNDDLVTGLGKEAFRVLEDGDPQRILEFYPEDRPITLAILIDTSGSMMEEMEEVHEAAGAFVETLRPDDRAMVIDFDDKVFLIQDLTNDQEKLKESIVSTKPLGTTAIYDAMHAAFRKMRDIEGRKAIVLLSDGEDTSSQFGYERVLEEAKANNIIIYGIGLGGGDKRVLQEFPELTGGRSFFVDKAAELAGVYERIALELRRQYYLTYSTDNEEWDGRWVKVKVELPGEKRLKVRARRGYFAVRRSS